MKYAAPFLLASSLLLATGCTPRMAAAVAVGAVVGVAVAHAADHHHDSDDCECDHCLERRQVVVHHHHHAAVEYDVVYLRD